MYKYIFLPIFTVHQNNIKMEKKTTKLNYRDLMNILGPEAQLEIEEQARQGDPDWLLDLLAELDYQDQDYKYYFPAISGPLIERGLKSDDFDQEEICAKIYSFDPNSSYFTGGK